jgi:hypothetical protein
MKHAFWSGLLAALFLIASGCSDSINSPDDTTDDGSTAGGLRISYQADDAMAASGQVTPAGGGTVAATGADGITYTLYISPAAVDTEVTVTVTPLSTLTISRLDTGLPDTSACVRGALFEPSGLEFDAPAVLTISYPSGVTPCTLSPDFRIVSLDSSSAFIEIIPTTVDINVPALSCTLSHFSGYGADDPDYEFLRYLIVESSKYGQSSPGWDVLSKLISYADEAASHGWSDLKDLAVQGCEPILGALADAAIAESQSDPGESTLAVLVRYWDAALGLGFDDIADRLSAAAEQVVRSIAAQGKAECDAGHHDTGRAILRHALDLILAGLVDDEAFKQQVMEWLGDCGEINITISPSTSLVRDVALNAGDEGTFVIFDVSVTTFSGQPVEGKSVGVSLENLTTHAGRGIASGSTDDTGHFFCMYAYSWNSAEQPGAYAFKAYTFDPQATSSVVVELAKTRYTLHYEWDYSYTKSWDTGSINDVSSMRGAGTGRSSHDPDCPIMTRSYEHVNQYEVGPGQTQTFTDRLLEMPAATACQFTMYYTSSYIDAGGFSIPVSYISRAIVHARTPMTVGRLERSASGYTQNYVDTVYSFDLADFFQGTFPVAGDKDLLYVDGMGFDTYSNTSTSTEGATGTLSLSIAVEAPGLGKNGEVVWRPVK